MDTACEATSGVITYIACGIGLIVGNTTPDEALVWASLFLVAVRIPVEMHRLYTYIKNWRKP